MIYEGQSNENRIPATKWQWNLFYSNVIARSVNTFIPLGDETINSSLVERGRSLMDPPHPLLDFLVRKKLMSMNVFLQVAKYVELISGKIWAVWRMLKCFPAKSLKHIPHQIGSMGMGIIMQKDDSVRPHSRAFWHMVCRSTSSHQETNCTFCSSFLASISSAGRTHFTLCSPREQWRKTVLTCAFSLFMSPTLQMSVSIHNNNFASFCEECVLWWVFGFHLTAPHI